jgi:hypothetical protein
MQRKLEQKVLDAVREANTKLALAQRGREPLLEITAVAVQAKTYDGRSRTWNPKGSPVTVVVKPPA